MSSNLLYSEILEEFEKAPKRADKIAVLRKNGDTRFKDFLLFAFHPEIKFDIEPPPYRPSIEPAGLNFAYLDTEVNKLYRFITNHPKKSPDLTQKKQISLLAVILESLHAHEAELLVRMFQKDLQTPYLTANIIKEAWPGFPLP